MDNRQEVLSIIDRYSIDKETLCDYILNNFLSGSDALEVVQDFTKEVLDIDLSDDDDDMENW